MKRNKKKNFNFVEENTFKFKNPQNPKNTINFIANVDQKFLHEDPKSQEN